MTSKTDARNETTGYSYDRINRNTYVSYNDGTPDIERHYDAAETCARFRSLTLLRTAPVIGRKDVVAALANQADLR